MEAVWEHIKYLDVVRYTVSLILEICDFENIAIEISVYISRIFTLPLPLFPLRKRIRYFPFHYITKRDAPYLKAIIYMP